MAECYADDGYTGTNFQRPAFQRMLRDVESGRIRCVLVKDLSRFGRDYIETGRYLERWLPEHGVRFIAVTDNIDSARGAYDMMMPLKNLFNTQYARDISRRSKAPSAPSSSGASSSEPCQLRLQRPAKPQSPGHRPACGGGGAAHLHPV